MPLPHLHILHPLESRLPGIGQWLADVYALLKSESTWDGCELHARSYDESASFDIPTEYGLIKEKLGPVILIQNVKGSLRDKLESMLSRHTCIYCIVVTSPEDIYETCELARTRYEDGEPRIPRREAQAYLIVRKLATMDRWGGIALNKSFLWAELLPKGGFPKDLSDRGEILEVAEALVRFGVLTFKTSSGQRKYALERKEIIQPILDSKSFLSHPKFRDIRAFFERKPDWVSVRSLDTFS